MDAARRAVLLKARLLFPSPRQVSHSSPRDPPPWHHMRGGHHQHTARLGPTPHKHTPVAGTQEALSSEPWAPLPCHQEGSLLWETWVCTSSRHRAPLCGLGDGGALVPSTGRETEAVDQGLARAASALSTRPPMPEADAWPPCDQQPVMPESSCTNAGGVFLCCPNIRVHRRSKAIVKQSKANQTGDRGLTTQRNVCVSRCQEVLKI